jgi:DEAD/DEAH box helicase domain-containing protein
VEVLARLLEDPRRRERVTHVESLPPRAADLAAWPTWLAPGLSQAWRDTGIEAPWRHQVLAAEHAWAGRHVVVSTGTASGKSLAYLMPALSAVLLEDATVLYLSPTKALAADQLRSLGRLRLDGLRAATVDGDCNDEEREWARRHASIVLTNPDMLHRSLLPRHQRWSPFWRRLRVVVIDECHGYRGIFGAHVAMVVRRLRRVAARHGAAPVFVLASATLAEPGEAARRLTGVDVVEVTVDGSPRGRLDVALWQPPELDQPPGLDASGRPDSSARAAESAAGPPGGTSDGKASATGPRRSATAEAADVLADLVRDDVRSVAFVPSRRGAEAVALGAQRRLADTSPSRVDRVAAYRAGYLAEDRRRLERDLHHGRLLGLASTNALELGVDVSGLDAVVIAGWPGTRVSLWQQAGRAGRGAQDAAAVFIARDDPLDTYLVTHPEALFGRPLEAAVFDPDNPCVLAPHLAATAAEAPLTRDEVAMFGPAAPDVLAELVAAGLLRRRDSGWYWTRRDRASDLTDLRGSGDQVQICESATGQLLGLVDALAADASVHPGAVYVHQGRTYLVDELDHGAGVALVHADDPDWMTSARSVSRLSIVTTDREGDLVPGARLHLGTVDVSTQVVGYLRRRLVTGEVLGEHPLDLPVRELRTTAVWWTVEETVVAAAGIQPPDLPGALHAAEHASIGLLPLVATCDRWDLGGLSTDAHPDTGLPTVFVYDGHPGGAGFAARGHDRAGEWLGATLDAVAGCGCEAGCPACVQSPKCGNGNEPLDKAGAIRLLSLLTGGQTPPAERVASA